MPFAHHLLPFLAGVLLGMGVAFWPYDVDRTFSVVPVLQLVATIVIVLLVQQIFERRYSEHRIEKDLLIGRVKEVQKLAAETSKHCHDTFLKQEINVFDEQLMLLKLRQVTQPPSPKGEGLCTD